MTILFVIAGIVVFIFAAKGIKIVRPWQKALIERLGKYQRTADSGLTVIIPSIERLIRWICESRWLMFPPRELSPRTMW